ncbi:P-loop containing nucleoside triphosphate hydrolase protein [Blastocladiella britannica]|nr:P-loop containing nucleoside triphosphate hydrolase protein [Blastocladiella britannica]
MKSDAPAPPTLPMLLPSREVSFFFSFSCGLAHIIRPSTVDTRASSSSLSTSSRGRSYNNGSSSKASSSNASSDGRWTRASADLSPPRQSGQRGHRDRPSIASDRRSGGSSSISSSTTTTTKSSRGDAEDLTPQEREQIRLRFLGSGNEKKRTRRMNERQFVFDWDASEDTSRDANPLYMKRAEYTAFGRGHVGGIDPRDSEDSKEQIDDRHWSQKSLKEMKERDWRIFKEDFDITTKGGQIPSPLRSWDESTIPDRVLDVIRAVGYKEPTPIQRQSIPIGMQNRDMMGVAETGSGKTLTFLVPMLSFIMKLPRLTEEDAPLGPYALVLVPTRELAQQIEDEATKFAGPLGYRCVSIVGGHSIEEQSFTLSRGCELIIATPGRLRDCLERHIVVLGQCTYVVMDEADRMIDMGFEQDVTYILDQLPISDEELAERAVAAAEEHAKALEQNMVPRESMVPQLREAQAMLEARRMATDEDAMYVDGNAADGDSGGPPAVRHKLPDRVLAALGGKHFRQTVMFSATMPPQVERLAQRYLRKPATVFIGRAGKAVDTVEQRVEFINDENRKAQRMMQLLSEYEAPIIVFFNQKRGVDYYQRQLQSQYRVTAMHGGKTQDAREASIAQLKRGEVDVLLATNVAGRGLDVHDVSLVINFDMAKNIEEYTHRIGRTGRAGKTGTAVTFLTNDDAEVLYDLKQLLLKSPVSHCPKELASHPDAQVRPGTFVAKRKFEETLYAR